MMPGPLKIVTVNTADRGGGAERRAWCLFKGFGARRRFLDGGGPEEIRR